jgi:hypothetical protein
MAVAATTLYLRNGKIFEPFVQSLLRFPGDQSHCLALVFLPLLHGLADQRFQPVVPGRFAQDAAAVAVGCCRIW